MKTLSLVALIFAIETKTGAKVTKKDENQKISPKKLLKPIKHFFDCHDFPALPAGGFTKKRRIA